MEWNMFDICEAWYLALSDCHRGQFSLESKRLARLSKFFRPSPFLTVDTLTENGRMIYDNVCANAGFV